MLVACPQSCSHSPVVAARDGMESAKELKLGVSAAKAHLLATFLVTLFLGTMV